MRPRVIYSPRPDAFREVCPDPEVYIGPKALLPELRRLAPCPVVAVEDVTKTPTWLWLNEAVRDGTRIVYDRVSRYYKVDSDKARKLSRLAEIGTVFLVDIVPFCEHRRNLYMPWRYVSRTVLGYQHYYAFTGGHYEERDGRLMHSLDGALLAEKVAPHVAACQPRAGAVVRSVQIASSEQEQAEYASKREALFAKYKTPQPILTRLADLSHGFESRRAAVSALLGPGAAVVCNLASYAAYYRQQIPTCDVGTYAKPPKGLARCTRVVYAEPPIIQTYHRLDIDAMLSDGTDVIEITSDTKVDRFLSGRIAAELAEVDTFMEALRARL